MKSQTEALTHDNDWRNIASLTIVMESISQAMRLGRVSIGSLQLSYYPEQPPSRDIAAPATIAQVRDLGFRD